jgi:hypothetical protein
VNGFAVVLLMIMAGVAAWGFTMVRVSGQSARLRAEIARIDRLARQEIAHWQDEAAGARTRAAQVERDSKAWAAGCKQGRDDVISVVPLLIAAQEGGAGGDQPGGSGAVEHV